MLSLLPSRPFSPRRPSPPLVVLPKCWPFLPCRQKFLGVRKKCQLFEQTIHNTTRDSKHSKSRTLSHPRTHPPQVRGWCGSPLCYVEVLINLCKLCLKKVYWEKEENLGQESRTQTGHGEGAVTTAVVEASGASSPRWPRATPTYRR
jgi:hypothetical protein